MKSLNIWYLRDNSNNLQSPKQTPGGLGKAALARVMTIVWVEGTVPDEGTFPRLWLLMKGLTV